MVNGRYCLTCADEHFARKQTDPSQAAHDRSPAALRREELRRVELGVNRPEQAASAGSRLNLFA